MEHTTKRCIGCEADLPVGNFTPGVRKRTGVLCQDCNKRKCKQSYHSLTPEQKRRRYDQIIEGNKRLRAEVLAAYGGACACCGEKIPEFLALDHVNNDGAEHRKKVGNGQQVYRWLRRFGFPKDGFRLLCHNCNQSRASYGACPHERMNRPALRVV